MGKLGRRTQNGEVTHPVVADTILGAERGAETSSTQAILKSSRILHDAGFESPAWGEGGAPEVVEKEEDPSQLRLGGQQKESQVSDREAPFHGFSVAATVGTRAGVDVFSERSTCQCFFCLFSCGPEDLSERSCFAGFVCLFPCLFGAVGVAVFSTLLATTVQQRVLGVGVSRSTGVQRRRCQSSGKCVRVGLQASRGCGGWSPSLWWCPGFT